MPRVLVDSRSLTRPSLPWEWWEGGLASESPPSLATARVPLALPVRFSLLRRGAAVAVPSSAIAASDVVSAGRGEMKTDDEASHPEAPPPAACPADPARADGGAERDVLVGVPERGVVGGEGVMPIFAAIAAALWSLASL